MSTFLIIFASNYIYVEASSCIAADCMFVEAIHLPYFEFIPYTLPINTKK